MNWLVLIVIAQGLNAAVVLIDKYLVTSKRVARPIVYTFYAGILSGTVIVLVPFGALSWPSGYTLILSLATGVTSMASLLYLYESISGEDASEVVPVIGAISAIATFIVSRIILKSELPPNFFAAMIFLIAGTLLLSHFHFHRKTFFFIMMSGICFGFASVFLKLLFLHDNFLNAFFWSRMGNVLVALFLLALPLHRGVISHNVRTSSSRTKYLVLGNKVVAGIAYIFTLLAIKYGDVAIVNALGGIQYILLLLCAIMFARRMPAYFKVRGHYDMVHKLVATVCIVIGLFILFV
ncbi:hypothetical protein KW783_00415 [Candidatus Parcubacteria bacterium]|nr:hypothetical protein [Candidatus Parcubacteria bacterium]